MKTNKTKWQLFWEKVDRTGECWLWTACRDTQGYGKFRAETGPTTAHRWAYRALVGPIPDDLTVDHLCLNTSCVNPAHMELVTRAENAYRGNRNVGKTHCHRGHEFTPENTYAPPSRPHIRDCRECRRTSHAEYTKRRAEQRQAA